jgi:23S rRNA (cytosine1962-C5)-methyltransferase
MNNAFDQIAPLVLRKGEERRLRVGHDWVYSNEIDTSRTPLRGLAPGQAVEILGQRGQWLAHGYANPRSLIAVRVTSRQRGCPFSRAELERRLGAALALRERLYPGRCYRWVYGESDGLPGLVVDRYGEFAIVQINTAGMERWRTEIVESLAALGSLRGIRLRCDSPLRELEGLPAYTETVHGTVPEEVEIAENDIRYIVPLAEGQKTGWFYDQADNRARARALLRSGLVIDGYCYVGGWGIAAALAGAERVVCVDSSERALDYVQRNAERNGVASKVGVVRADVEEALRDIRGKERPGTLILDPPAFVKRKKDLEAGKAAYVRLNQLALDCLPAGGFLISCSCSQHVDRDAFLRVLQTAACRGDRALRLLFEGGQSADHPVHPAMPETRYLKALFMYAAGGPGSL